uniref:F-box domain-containing protein n=1 Tax=Triticum aestivum TaxID=4565 RepID=A0A077S7E9_WHEAT|nr:unnamed protein product [Triticum aestivum]
MAAAPGDILPPLATPALLPLVKRVNEEPSFPQASPVIPAMTVEDWSKWSTLPPDLVRRIADSLLSTNDLDYYIHFHAVSPSSRTATDVPMSNTFDPRLRPHRWIVLDEDFQSKGKLLLLNTQSGRFLHRNIQLLSDHYVVATTRNGYLVLANKMPPHLANILNPTSHGRHHPFRGTCAPRGGIRCCRFLCRLCFWAQLVQRLISHDLHGLP